MPIDSTHEFYKLTEKHWEKVRDTFTGTHAVKDRGEKYLPKLSGQSPDEYNAYKLRALYFNAIERTVQGLIGAVMRVDPLIEVPKEMDEWLKDITRTGVSINSFISNMLSEQLLMNRQGVLVDFDEANDRPYLIRYDTEQITNWFTDTIILKESYENGAKDDPYIKTYKIQYRELLLVDGKYIVRIWKETSGKSSLGNGKWEVQGEPLEATNSSNNALNYIPFVALSSEGINLYPDIPTLLPLTDVSLSMYRTSADLEHGRHWVSIPQPWIAGVDNEQAAKMSIGGGNLWGLGEKGSAGFMEFSGAGLASLERAIVEKKDMMAGLGAQLLQSRKSGVESADSIRLRQNAEASTLIYTVKTVEQGIINLLKIMAENYGIDSKDINVKLNTDFVDTRLSSQDLKELMAVFLGGGISQDTFLYQMKKGEILDAGVDIETEKSKIELESGTLE